MLFNGLNLEEKLEESYHTIVTDHPYMHEIGLSAFTTGELYSWMIRKNSNEDLTNLKLIDNVKWKKEDLDELTKENYQNNILLASSLILGERDTDPIQGKATERYYFTAPRITEDPNTPQARPVEYIKFNNKAWDKWTYINKNGSISYVAKNLGFSYFDNISYLTSETKEGGYQYELKSYTPSIGYNLDLQISNIIEMNNYIRLLNTILPESEWAKYPYLNGSRAIAEFIRDIKSSKEQCIQWEGFVPFILNFDGITTASKCLKTVKVKYKLYLYDTATPRDASRKITFTNDFTIVGQHIDALGRVGQKEDGEVITPGPGNPKDSIAANLRVYYNPSTRKYESGTAQMVARMLDDLEPAKATDLDKILNLNVTDLQTPTYQHLVTVGTAIPIINQNANPLLWAPEYNEPKSCRKTNDKNTLTVYNISHKRFKKGETVLLQNIGGAWIPSSLGEQDTGGTASFDGRWSFTYLMTNADAFFRNINGTQLDYNSYEMGVHNFYYGGGDTNSNEQWNPTSVPNPAIIDVFNGYYQVTSFDFMGKRIGGTRDLGITTAGGITDVGNSISCTQFSIGPDDENLENGGKFLYGKTSAPFFGCVFPDGYSTEDDETKQKIITYKVNTPEIKSCQYNAINDTYDENALMFENIPENTQMFENKNDNKMNTSSANKLGMFYKINDNANTTFTLKHLPADIATHASPTGTNGYPITNINSIWRALIPYNISSYQDGANSITAISSEQFREQLHEYLMHVYNDNKTNYTSYKNDKVYLNSRLNWLYTASKVNSAFDFKPVAPNKIQFRPLKTELYAAWECPIRPYWMMSSTNPWVVADKGGGSLRSAYGALNWEMIYSDNPIVSMASWHRNNDGWRNWLFDKVLATEVVIDGVTYKMLLGKTWGTESKQWPIGPTLRYNNDIYYRWTADQASPGNSCFEKDYSNPRTPAYNNGQSACKGGKDGCAKCWIPDNSANFPHPWWSRSWMIGGKLSSCENTNGLPIRGAGGIGIIAAQAEITAFKGVSFTTENYLGVRSWFLNSKWYPSWGWRNDYNSFNTIALHAKVKHKWPRHLTVYDPRFFAIFYFNPPGCVFIDNGKYVDTDIPSPVWYDGVFPITDIGNYPTLPNKGSEQYPNGIYRQDQLGCSVDMRIPTIDNGFTPNDNSDLWFSSVYEDITISPTNKQYNLRAQEFWAVDYSRRNKLLPYKYKVATVGIQSNVDNNGKLTDVEILEYPKSVKECKAIVIINGGSRYKETDIFTTVGGSSKTPALFNPVVDGNGGIIGFKYIYKKITRLVNNKIELFDDPQSGAGFNSSHFSSSTDIISPNYVFKVKITPVSTKGKGFVGGVVKGGIILSPLMEDAKPGYATSSEVLELSAKPPSTSETSSNKYDSGGSIESTVIKEVDMNITTNHSISNPSPDNKYDIFLFFHNDISAHMMDSWEQGGGGGVPPVPQENHITLTVNPT